MKQVGRTRWWALGHLLVACILWLAPAVAQSPTDDEPWYRAAAGGKSEIQLYFFWSSNCPHCLEALPFVERLAGEYEWLQLHSLEVSASPQNARRYVALARVLGQEASAVPGFLFCGEMHVGYDSEENTGALLRARLLQCRIRLESGAGVEASTRPDTVDLPLFGRMDPQQASLPLVTLMLAGLDAFNPCAFFVLLFLLSLMVHARSRVRMALVGGVFVLTSGLVYFVFMAAWLNVFMLFGELLWVTVVAGLAAVTIGALNLKDYIWPGRGPTLSIPQGAKPTLFARMRGLLGGTALVPTLFATGVLAIVANSYELLCTAGFPMVYTRILTLHSLPTSAYYGYLVLYNLIYVVPLAVIVAVFSATLGARKLGTQEGRLLKLLSGTMMSLLGVLLLLAPHLLGNAWIASALLVASLAIVGTIALIGRLRARRPGR